MALDDLMGTTPEQGMPGFTATGATKTLGPPSEFQRGGALRLGTELRGELGQGETGLKLEAIHGHDRCLVRRGESPVCAVRVTKTDWAEETC
jgi:hypothetical protein